MSPDVASKILSGRANGFVSDGGGGVKNGFVGSTGGGNGFAGIDVEDEEVIGFAGKGGNGRSDSRVGQEGHESGGFVKDASTAHS